MVIHGGHLNLEMQVQPGLSLPWDREDILELLGNLLDNACKWADSEVLLIMNRQETRFCIVVEDDGPGIPEARREEVFGRGARLDEQITGHGLGLGIVRDIVQAWGGNLQLEASHSGGLRVCIDLPDRLASEQAIN